MAYRIKTSRSEDLSHDDAKIGATVERPIADVAVRGDAERRELSATSDRWDRTDHHLADQEIR